MTKSAYCIITQIIEQDAYAAGGLDSNCPDKDSAIAAAVAMWYLAGITYYEQIRRHYLQTAVRAAQFALSYFMLWDIPFVPGHALAQLGFKSRGWGICSVENNHINSLVFEFLDVLRWVSRETEDSKYAEFAEVIKSSTQDQLLPREGRMYGVAQVGYHPAIVQHSFWDYGRGAKGHVSQNNFFGAPVASLWRMLEQREFGFPTNQVDHMREQKACLLVPEE